MACQQWPDPTLIHTVTTSDPHDATARQIFRVPEDARVPKELRVKSKNGVFGWIYSMPSRFLNPYARGGHQVAEQWATAMPEWEFDDILKEAQLFITQMDAAFPHLKSMIEASCVELQAQGYLRDVCGWRVEYYVNGRERSKNAHEMRMAINKLVQGPSARMTGLARIYVQEFLEQEYWDHNDVPLLVNDIHDQLVIDTPPDLAAEVRSEVTMIMENLPTRDRYGWDLAVPLRVDCEEGEGWG